jgi:pantetheine-phosphate adenylyltransferase
MPRYGTAVLGGTFDHLHVGHEALLATAFRLGRRVAIGVTTPAYLAAHPKPDGDRIQSYATRRRNLERWISARFPGRAFVLRPLADGFGGSVGPGVGVLVISADTLAGGRAVNRQRRRLGRRAVPLAIVPLALADDLQPVSSRRIRAGEIDRRGRVRGPIDVSLRVPPADQAWARRAVRAAFPKARFSSGRARSEGPLTVTVRRRAHGVREVALRRGPVRLAPRVVPDVPPRLAAQALRRYLRPSVGGPG